MEVGSGQPKAAIGAYISKAYCEELLRFQHVLCLDDHIFSFRYIKSVRFPLPQSAIAPVVIHKSNWNLTRVRFGGQQVNDAIHGSGGTDEENNVERM